MEEFCKANEREYQRLQHWDQLLEYRLDIPIIDLNVPIPLLFLWSSKQHFAPRSSTPTFVSNDNDH